MRKSHMLPAVSFELTRATAIESGPYPSPSPLTLHDGDWSGGKFTAHNFPTIFKDHQIWDPHQIQLTHSYQS